MKPWIQTYTCQAFDPLRPDPALIRIEDIAHSLANVCRFTGHTRSFYSVAEHSFLVSANVPKEDRFAGLLHDASEAYLCDIAAPVKQHPMFDGYREAEARLQAMILEKFTGSPELPASVKLADGRMLATEARQVMTPLHPQWAFYAEPYEGLRVMCWSPETAKAVFLETYHELVGGLGGAI